MIKAKNEEYMRAALAEAKKAFDRHEVPVGAVVVCNDIIIARAHNLTETLNDPTAHAEMQAITAATDWLGGKYLTDCTIYVTIGALRNVCRCNWMEPGINLVFGAGDENKGYRKISESLLHPKTIVESGVLEYECREILLNFLRKRDKSSLFLLSTDNEMTLRENRKESKEIMINLA